jgi:hypothetical protein
MSRRVAVAIYAAKDPAGRYRPETVSRERRVAWCRASVCCRDFPRPRRGVDVFNAQWAKRRGTREGWTVTRVVLRAAPDLVAGGGI